MTQQIIGVGAAPNDGTGDPLRTAFTKANDNFTELYTAAFTTGDAKLTFKTVADAGWIILNDGSIGNAASAATTRANADTVTLYTLFWNNIGALVVQDNTGTPVARGGSAAADYAANRRLVCPAVLGRALAIAGTGSGLTARVLGSIFGEETHALTGAELAPHTHGINSDSAGSVGSNFNQGAAGADFSAVSQSAGSGAAHNTMQPTTFLNVMVKL